MRKTILGSETEFGFIVRDKKMSERQFLSELGRNFPTRIGMVSTVEMEKSTNWWEEDLRRREHIGLSSGYDADAFRRMGASGEYVMNGARMYIDVHHPEYSSPECLTPRELVAYERAGEILMHNAAQVVEDSKGISVDILKRNWDYHRASYACHENYLLTRVLFRKIVPEGRLIDVGYESEEQAMLVMHLITRQFFTGSGRFDASLSWPKAFSLSQRQPFVGVFSTLETTSERGIINTRDRAYADSEKWARLHVICGDSNRADWSNALKYGTTLLILSMLEDWDIFSRSLKSKLPFIHHPVRMFSSIRDEKSLIHFFGKKRSLKALDVQYTLLEMVQKWNAWAIEEGKEVSWASETIAMWEETLQMFLERDETLYKRFDYLIKKRLFEERIQSGKSIDVIQALDYHYHVIEKDSLFEHLREKNFVDSIISFEDVVRAMQIPPETRARTRKNLQMSESAEGAENSVVLISWHVLELYRGGTYQRIRLPDPFGEEIQEEDLSSYRLLPIKARKQ